MAEHQSLATLANRLVLLFVVTNLLSLGMSRTVKEIVDRHRAYRTVSYVYAHSDTASSPQKRW